MANPVSKKLIDGELVPASESVPKAQHQSFNKIKNRKTNIVPQDDTWSSPVYSSIPRSVPPPMPIQPKAEPSPIPRDRSPDTNESLAPIMVK